MEDRILTQEKYIAIIVPVYNAQKYIKQCIRSIQKQTFRNYKLILVDDGSKDTSGKICDQFASKDERIIVIHQENKGSVEARKTGVFSKEAQESEYLCFVDADDMIEKDALQKLYEVSVEYNADQVCANTRSCWKSIKIKSKFQRPCFKIQKAQVYTKKDIMEKLYISCFGITDFPVTLYAKLYKTELITKAVDFDAIVKFMGDDISVTLRCLPQTQKLVIIPDIIYNYRVGGGTSKFMSYMLDDFIALYREKRKLVEKYLMPQDALHYMNIELMNIVFSWLIMCKNKGKYSEEKMYEEIEKVSHVSEINNAAKELHDNKEKNHIAQMILECDQNKIYNEILQLIQRDKKKNLIKAVINKL